MDNTDPSMWMYYGMALVVLDVFVGSFYLAVLGAACLVTALVSWFDLTVAWQLVSFATTTLAGGATVYYVRRFKTNYEADTLQNLDIGKCVMVDDWTPQGTAFVTYRGAQWQATAQEGAERRPGAFEIVAVNGPILVLKNM
ncbi:MAG: NfeD family protein [Sutterellaceae bacterium]|nr:NfeD family protein [Sutterellaceae bacterium]